MKLVEKETERKRQKEMDFPFSQDFLSFPPSQSKTLQPAKPPGFRSALILLHAKMQEAWIVMRA